MLFASPFLARTLIACGLAVALAGAAGAETAKKPEKDAGADKPNLLVAYGDWSVYQSKSGKNRICYTLAQPKERLPADLKRDPGYAFISERPSERVRHEVSFIMGFDVAGAPAARADDLPVLVFHNHRFEPARIEVPAHQKFKLQVKNTDDTADEFESVELNREKLVAPGQSITVFLGPLEPGEYKFFGDFHQDTAQGVLVAK